MWIEKKKGPVIRKKGQGRDIMVSAFVTRGGVIKVPDYNLDAELLATSNLLVTDAGSLVREAVV